VSPPEVIVEWRGAFDGPEVEALHAEGFGHPVGAFDWRAQVERHSLGWVTARAGGHLIGWVNVAWDGAGHAFILDTVVAGSARHRGLATELVTVATDHARAAGCEWLHVDFDAELESLYLGACGFHATPAGLIRL
jgi:ribosomal protein S18 acetylase RimI-like enzyme